MDAAAGKLVRIDLVPHLGDTRRAGASGYPVESSRSHRGPRAPEGNE
jgi:hypothetical protein